MEGAENAEKNGEFRGKFFHGCEVGVIVGNSEVCDVSCWWGMKRAWRWGCWLARGKDFSMGRMRRAVAQASASMAVGAMVMTFRRLVLLVLVVGSMRWDWRVPSFWCSKNW